MSITIQELDMIGLDCSHEAITIMPYTVGAGDEGCYSSTALSFWKEARKQVDINLFSEPQSLVEQRSSEWFGPTVLFTSAMFTGNSELVSVYCSVLYNSLYDFFKGHRPDPVVKLKVLYTETESSKTTEISYEGDVEGIKSLENTLNELVKKGV